MRLIVRGNANDFFLAFLWNQSIEKLGFVW